MTDFQQPSSPNIPFPNFAPGERPAPTLAVDTGRANRCDTRLVFCPAHRRKLESLAEMSYPFEACGVLAGEAQDDGEIRVHAVWSARNVGARAQDRYRIDPEHFLAAERIARDRGLDIVGIWHSHPNQRPVPSRTDLEEAWDGISYLILGIDPWGRVEMRSWRKSEDGASMFEERVRFVA